MRIELKKRLSQQASRRHFPAGSMARCLEIKLCNVDRERKIIWPDEHTVTVKETSFMPVVFVCRFAVIVKWAASEDMFTQKHNNLAYCAQFPKECINSANILSAHLNPFARSGFYSNGHLAIKRFPRSERNERKRVIIQKWLFCVP